jgi:hypothetical protein
VGHPEHGLLFIATQVAGATGLLAPKESVRQYAQSRSVGVFRVAEVLGGQPYAKRPEGIHAPTWAKELFNA